MDEQVALSHEMAIRLHKAFGADMEVLIRMQGSYDIAEARQQQAEISVARNEAKGRDPRLGLSERKWQLYQVRLSTSEIRDE
ncbi:MAG: hypothetical protein WAS21_06125 [Geminicoccaceae bacterium]